MQSQSLSQSLAHRSFFDEHTEAFKVSYSAGGRVNSPFWPAPLPATTRSLSPSDASDSPISTSGNTSPMHGECYEEDLQGLDGDGQPGRKERHKQVT